MDGLEQIVKAIEVKFGFTLNPRPMDGIEQIVQAINDIVIPSSYNDIDGTGYETVSRNIYVSGVGSDITGTGTQINPFFSVPHAINTIKTNINPNVAITITLDNNFCSCDQTELYKQLRGKRFFSDSSLVITGTDTNIYTGLTITASATPYIYNVTGASLIDLISTYGRSGVYMSDGTNYYPIASNTANTINAPVGAVGCTKIVLFQAGLLLNDNDVFHFGFDMPSEGTQKFQITKCFFTSNSVPNLQINSTNCVLDFIHFGFSSDYLKVSFQKTDFNNSAQRCYFAQEVVINNAGTQLKSCTIRKYTGIGTAGLSINQNYQRICAGMYIKSFATGIVLQNGNFDFNLAGGALILDTCTSGISVRNNTICQFTTNNPIYIVGAMTNFLISSETITNNLIFTVDTIVGTAANMIITALKSVGFYNEQRGIFIKIPGVSSAAFLPKTLVKSTPTSLFQFTINDGENKSAFFHYCIQVKDVAGDIQTHSGIGCVSAVRKGAVITASVNEVNGAETFAASSGTLTDTWTVTGASGVVTVLVNSVPTLTPVLHQCYIHVIENGIIGAMTYLFT